MHVRALPRASFISQTRTRSFSKRTRLPTLPRWRSVMGCHHDRRAALAARAARGARRCRRSRSRPTSRHLEIYTMRGLLTLLWHGPADARRRASSRAAAGWAACSARPTASTTTSACELAAHGIGDRARRLPQAQRPVALRARRGRGRRPRGPVAARAGSSTMGHSFGGAVAIQAGVGARRALPRRRHARRRSRPAARSRPSSATLRCCSHGTDDEILPPETSGVVQMLAGHGEVVLLPGAGHLLTRSRRRAPRAPRRLDPGAPRDDAPRSLGAGELGDDRRELVDVVVADDDVRQAPPSRRRCSCSMISSSVPTSAAPDSSASSGVDAEPGRERLGQLHAVVGDAARRRSASGSRCRRSARRRPRGPTAIFWSVCSCSESLRRVGADLAGAQVRVDADDVGLARRDRQHALAAAADRGSAGAAAAPASGTTRSR